MIGLTTGTNGSRLSECPFLLENWQRSVEPRQEKKSYLFQRNRTRGNNTKKNQPKEAKVKTCKTRLTMNVFCVLMCVFLRVFSSLPCPFNDLVDLAKTLCVTELQIFDFAPLYSAIFAKRRTKRSGERLAKVTNCKSSACHNKTKCRGGWPVLPSFVYAARKTTTHT